MIKSCLFEYGDFEGVRDGSIEIRCTNYYLERPTKSDCNLILDWHFVTVISKQIPLIIVMHKSIPSFQ